MRRLFVISICLLLFASCKKSGSADSAASPPGGGTTYSPGVAKENHKASGSSCKDTTWLILNNYSFAGNTFYVDSGYIKAGNGIVAAISGSPEIRFLNDSSYSVIKDSTDYFPSYLSSKNYYNYDGNVTISFNTYTFYSIVGYILCRKTVVYNMTQYSSYGNNKLTLYRNL